MWWSVPRPYYRYIFNLYVHMAPGRIPNNPAPLWTIDPSRPNVVVVNLHDIRPRPNISRHRKSTNRTVTSQEKKESQRVGILANIMRLPISTLLLATLQSTATLAHWNYDRIIVNGNIIGLPYQHVRKTNNSNTPLQNVNSTDMRCNSGASSGIALKTQTYGVAAGDMLGFAIKDTFGHPGPQQVYISKAPGLAAEYEGDRDWTKIYSLTYSLNSSDGASDGLLKWATHNARTFNFRLPVELPAGEYLLRAEGLALHAAHKANNAQFYVACAQINVTGSGKGMLGLGIRFPGGYRWNSTGVLIPEFWSKIKNYTAPGPKLWPEGTREAHVLDGVRKTGAD
jgi:hypothetical protein